MRVTGGCHCGAVRFEADVEPQAEVLDCNCSICRMTGHLHLFVPHEQFRLIEGGSELVSYSFGSHAAEHLFCRHCGIKSFYQPRSHPEAWSVNLRCLDERNSLNPRIVPFDGSNWESAAEKLHGKTEG